MMPILLAVLLQQAPAPADRSVRIAVGGQLGFPHILGVVGRSTFHRGGLPRYELDLLWEPSVYLQSYSVGAAWRPGGSIFAVGPRLRLLQFVPPWSRAADPLHNHFGLGLDAALRIGLGESKRGVLNIGLQGTFVLTAPSANQYFFFGLFAGFTWSVWERAY
jgi:hypothetical protein